MTGAFWVNVVCATLAAALAMASDTMPYGAMVNLYCMLYCYWQLRHSGKQ